MYVVSVTIWIKPEHVDDFTQAILANARVVDAAQRQRKQDGVLARAAPAVRTADHDVAGVGRLHPRDGVEQQHAPLTQHRHDRLVHRTPMTTMIRAAVDRPISGGPAH